MPNNANFYAHLEAQFPADLATSCIITAQAADYSWHDLNQASAKLANLLQSLGLPAKARIAVQLDPSPEALILTLAILRAGLILMHVPGTYQSKEMQPFIEINKPAVVICSPKNFGWLAQLAFQLRCSHVFTLNNSYPNQGSLLQRAAPLSAEFNPLPTQADDVACISVNLAKETATPVEQTHNQLSANLPLTLSMFRDLTGFTLAF